MKQLQGKWGYRIMQWPVLGIVALALSTGLVLAQSVPAVTGNAQVDKLLS